jgi:CRISPR-associated protein Csd2
MTPIKNRYEFLLIFDCENGNPNGDPDANNLPRTDQFDGHGLVSSESMKRRIRDYAQLMGEKIFVQHQTNQNRFIFEARARTGDANAVATKSRTQDAAAWMCQQFFDVRTFGAVLSSGVNAGQLTGPVQINIAESIDPVEIMEYGITRVAVTDPVKGAKSLEDYERWEAEHPEDKLKTMGRKSCIRYGLFVAKGFISAFKARETGFSLEDLGILLESTMFMYKGLMTMRRVILFKHVGVRKDPAQNKIQAMRGCTSAQRLLEQGQVVTITRIEENAPPRAFKDYTIAVDETKLPVGVELLDLDHWDEEVMQNGWVRSKAK